MKAMVLEQFGEPLVYRQMPDPVPGEGELVIRVRACGLCGTDLKIASGKHPASGFTAPPRILGHEVAGEVAALGPGVTGFRPGDRVGLALYAPCGHCRFCRAGRETLCEQIRTWLGFRDPGGMAEYTKVAAHHAIPLPDSVSFAQASVIGCSGATGYHAVAVRAGVQAGQAVLVLGAGGVGSVVAQVARIAGARVVVADVSQAKLDLARQMGITETVLMGDSPEEAADRIRAAAGGRPQVIFECSGAPAAQRTAGRVVDTAGRIVLVGYNPGPEMPLSSQDITLREIEVLGSRAGGVRECKEVINWVAEGRFQPAIDRVLPLAEANTAIDLVRAGEALGRIVLEP